MKAINKLSLVEIKKAIVTDDCIEVRIGKNETIQINSKQDSSIVKISHQRETVLYASKNNYQQLYKNELNMIFKRMEDVLKSIERLG
jgi:hypothetical protein